MNVAANYTVQDLTGTVLGCILFVPLLLAPGYVAAWFSGVLGFRGLTAPWRVLVSLPLSVALCPIMTYWAGIGGQSVFGHGAVWAPVFALYGLCFALWLTLLAGLWGHEPLPRWLREFRPVPRVGWVVPAVWFLVATVSLVDLQIGNGLYLSVADGDHTLRTAVTDAISRAGVRPFNALYFLGSPAPLRYHYFWFLLCSMDAQAGAALRPGSPLVSSQEANIASVVWCGWALIAMVPLYLRFLHERTGVALRRCSLIGIGLFAVTGLDIVPTVLDAAKGRIRPEMEWWNEQVTSWLGSLLWVPHHVAGLVTGLMGFLLVWDAGRAVSLRRRVAGCALAGVAFATLPGTSIHLSFIFAVFGMVWLCVTLFRRWWTSAAVLAIAGVVAVALALPYLVSLTGPGAGSDGSLLVFEIRRFYPLDRFMEDMSFDRFSMAYMRLLALPLNYFLELGFFGVAAVAFLWGLRGESPLRPGILAGMTMMAVSVALCTFLKLNVDVGNDLGWRGFLPAQFIMLLWGAEVMWRRGERAQAEGNGFRIRWLRSAVWAPLIVLGLAGTAWEFALLRTFLIWNDGKPPADEYYPTDYGARALDLRRAYETLDRILPAAAKLQTNPATPYTDFTQGLYARRQTVAADRACGAEFGGDPAKCPHAFTSIAAIFDGDPDVTWERVKDVCREFAIDALIVNDTDPAWAGFNNWTRTARPAISLTHVRVYLMGGPQK